MTLEIITNNHARPILDWFELTPQERESFDWMDKPEESGKSFFRYRGSVYALADFMRAPSDLSPWDGYAGDSCFSGTLVRLAPDGDSVTCGRYFS